MIRVLLLFAVIFAAGHAAETRTLVFFGDSLTAGLGVDPDEAFPALIQKKIEAAGKSWRVVNAGLSGETTAGGLRRLDWILRQPVDLIVVELGANDGLRGLKPEVTRANLQAIIDRIRTHDPKIRIVLAGMRVPTNLGPEYTASFAAIFPELATANKITLIPFLLEGVGGHPELNQGDGMHPTPAGHAKVADNVWTVLAPLL
ncbi:MAG TPA: arylesterase [Candidatus Didemnitutus sp.]|nr:arylesterase [Candidatus Didemnitutus sp.]